MSANIINNTNAGFPEEDNLDIDAIFGGGDNAVGGNITITGGTINAYSGKDADINIDGKIFTNTPGF